MVNGVQQSPIEGTSMLYTFNEEASPERHDLQYFEMFGNRGIYDQGWSAVTKHKTPWIMVGGDMPAFDDDVWELYDSTSDYSQAVDLSKEHPELLAKLQRKWLIEATKFNVLPMDDRTAERLEPKMAGRPTLVHGDTQKFYPGMGRLSENSVVSIKNKSFSVTAEVDVPAAGIDGVIIAQGGRFGGWAVYAKDGLLKFVYNVLGIEEFIATSDSAVPEGTHQVRAEFAYDGGGLGKGGDVTLYCDGDAIGTGRIGGTQPMVFSADETTDIGYESGTPVGSEYDLVSSKFSGKIHWVQIDLGSDTHDHLIDPEDRHRIAMGSAIGENQRVDPLAGRSPAWGLTLIRSSDDPLSNQPAVSARRRACRRWAGLCGPAGLSACRERRSGTVGRNAVLRLDCVRRGRRFFNPVPVRAVRRSTLRRRGRGDVDRHCIRGGQTLSRRFGGHSGCVDLLRAQRVGI
jgi:hypothetical protein